MTETTTETPAAPLPDLIRTLDRDGRLADYAKACGTTDKYLRNHVKRKTRTPRRRLMWALADHSGKFGEAISRDEVIAFFMNSEEVPTN